MRFFGILILCTLIACQSNFNTDPKSANSIYQPNFKTSIKYAKGFEMVERDSCSILKVISLSEKYPFSDSLILPLSQVSVNHKLWSANWKKFACQSTTHLTFLNALGAIEKVVALSDINFMPKDELYETILKQNVVELRQNDGVNVEKLVGLNPDLFLMYPFEWEDKKYSQAGIKTLLVAEYLEKTPIARLEWLKFFGVLIGEEAKADSLFNDIAARYHTLVADESIGKTVFFNLPFKDLWDMPAPQSITVNMVKDAGLDYIFDDTLQSIDNLSFPAEMVWSKAHEADYWIIVANRSANYSMADLLAEAPVYGTFESVKSNQVIFCNSGTSSYFTQGILEPDVMLKDLLYLTGQIDNHTPKYFKILG